MNKIHFLLRKIPAIILLFGFFYNANSQNFSNNFITELVIVKSKNGKDIPGDRFIQNTNVELDLKEKFALVISKTNVSFGTDPTQCFECCAREIQIETTFEGKITEQKRIPLGFPIGIQPNKYPLNIEDVIPKDVRDNLNTRNINELNIIIRIVWYKTSEVPTRFKGVFPDDLVDERIDIFTINVNHFGVLFLVDLAPVAKSNTIDQLVDVTTGILYNLSYSGIDYAVISKDNNFTTALLTAPIIKIEGRNWLNKNIEGHITLLKDINNPDNYLGYGFGLGLFGDTKILKTGVFWYEKDSPHFYVGVSLIGLSKWLTKRNNF